MEIQNYPKWIESADSTPEQRKGIVVQNAAEEKALREKMSPPPPPPPPPVDSKPEELGPEPTPRARVFGKKG